jgi:hypothetical protein
MRAAMPQPHLPPNVLPPWYPPSLITPDTRGSTNDCKWALAAVIPFHFPKRKGMEAADYSES